MIDGTTCPNANICPLILLYICTLTEILIKVESHYGENAADSDAKIAFAIRGLQRWISPWNMNFRTAMSYFLWIMIICMD